MGISVFLADISVTTKSKNSELPEVLYVSLLFPGRNLKTFRRFLDPHFSPTKRKARNEGLKIVEMSSNYDQGTTTTHTTLQISQSLFDLVVTEISARNEIPIQSLLKIRFRNDVSGYLIYSLRAWTSCGAISPIVLCRYKFVFHLFYLLLYC